MVLGVDPRAAGRSSSHKVGVQVPCFLASALQQHCWVLTRPCSWCSTDKNAKECLPSGRSARRARARLRSGSRIPACRLSRCAFSKASRLGTAPQEAMHLQGNMPGEPQSRLPALLALGPSRRRMEEIAL